MAEERVIDASPKSGKSALIEPGSSSESTMQDAFMEQFTSKAEDGLAFHALFRATYGEVYDRRKAERLRLRALNGDYRWLPKVRLLDGHILHSANGCYDKESATVFVNEKLKRDLDALSATFAHEVGHHIGALIGQTVAAGDEGEMFQGLLAGEKLSAAERQRIRQWDDRGAILLGGKTIEVKFWNPIKKAKKALKKAAKAAAAAAQAIADAVQESAAGVGEAIEGFVENIVDGDFKSAFGSLVNGALRASFGAGRTLLDGALKFSEDVWDATTEFFPDRLGDTLRRGWPARVLEATRSVTMGGWDLVAGAVRNTFEGLGTFLGGIGKIFSGDSSGFRDLGIGLLKIFIQTPIDALLLGGGKAISAIQTLIYAEPKGRRLKKQEINELYTVYRDSIDYDQVRLKEEGFAGLFGLNDRPFTLGNTIYLKQNAELPLLVHEMAHVWQFQNGGSDYMSEAIWSQNFGKEYNWCQSVPDTKWRDLEPEQQAQLLEDAYDSKYFDRQESSYGTFLFDCDDDGGNEEYTQYLKATLEQVRAGRGAP